MKLTRILTSIGIGVLVSGFIPYRTETDEETGEKKYRALFWKASKTPKNEEEGQSGELSLKVGFFAPGKDEDEDEADDLFADELTIEYGEDEDEAVVTVTVDEGAEDGEAEESEEAEESGEPEEEAEAEAESDEEKPEA